MKTLRERQLDRETSQVERGVLRYRAGRASKPEAEGGPGLTLLLRSMEPVIEGIADELDKPANRRTVAASYLEQLEPEAVAYITARVCINAGAERQKLTKTALSIARVTEEHVQFSELDEEAAGLANHMQRKARKWTTSFHRRAIMRKAAEIAEVRGLEWSDGDKLKLGMKLIELFIERTGLVDMVQVREGKQTIKYLQLTDAASAWLDDRHAAAEFTHPFREPMLVPPVDWTSPIRGGFLTPECREDFVLQTKAETRDDLFSSDIGEVYRAVNHIQSTPWRINHAVYDLMSQAWDAQSEIGGLPPADARPLPARPEDIPKDVPMEDLSEGDRARIMEYTKAARAVHEENVRMISQRVALIRQLTMARGVIDEDRVYFPHNVDFRGRIYPLVPDLSPQANDTGKALLEFADGKPLGESGGFWLCVHVANLFGIDKISFEDRVIWTMMHKDQLIDSADDPFDGQRFWTEADDPWCALAACMEFAGFMEEGDEFVSHLPIAMDGSCSGLQHFSAMLRDPVGGRATNLTKLDSPADVYTEVMERVKVLLGEAGTPEALAWLGDENVTRKIVKRPCMTYAYSVTSRGMRDQILDEMRKQRGDEYILGWDNYSMASYLAPLVEQAIRQTVDRAAAAMDWLQEITRMLMDEEMPIVWRTPDHFPVVQRYMKTNGKKFKVYFNGIRLRLTLRVETTTVDRRKQTSAIAPNFVHSMDAYHLRRVVNRLIDEEVTCDFAMIHDSFGVHAADVDDMHYVIRDEFIAMYTDDRLLEFYQQALLSMPGDRWPDVPKPPTMGDLDLEEVRDADFFFA